MWFDWFFAGLLTLAALYWASTLISAVRTGRLALILGRPKLAADRRDTPLLYWGGLAVSAWVLVQVAMFAGRALISAWRAN